MSGETERRRVGCIAADCGRTMAALLCASEIQSAAAGRILPKGTEEKKR